MYLSTLFVLHLKLQLQTLMRVISEGNERQLEWKHTQKHCREEKWCSKREIGVAVKKKIGTHENIEIFAMTLQDRLIDTRAHALRTKNITGGRN